LCQLLIAANADVNAKDECAFMFKMCYWFCAVLFSCLPLTPYASNRETPLILATFQDKPDIVALLRGVGAKK